MFISAVQGAHLSYRSFYFLLSGIKEEIGMPFLHLLFFYVQNNSLAQSKPYAKVANLGWCILSFFVTNIHLFKVKSKAHKFFLDSWTPDRFDLKKKKKAAVFHLPQRQIDSWQGHINEQGALTQVRELQELQLGLAVMNDAL